MVTDHRALWRSSREYQYDFFLFTFNTQGQNGTVTFTTKVSPFLNTLGDSRPMGLALQVDGGASQTKYFVPPVKPSGKLQAGHPACRLVEERRVGREQHHCRALRLPGTARRTGSRYGSRNFRSYRNAHPLTRLLRSQVWMIEPTVVVQKIVIGERGGFCHRVRFSTMGFADTGGVKPSYLGPPEGASACRVLSDVSSL